MFSKLKLDRPLAVFDIEATGLSPRADRIVELSVIRIEPNGRESTCTWLLNPCVPIPLEATAIHGITDEDVRDCPTFLDVVDEIDAFLADCDLAGYNLIHFDIPILEEEFLRCGRDLRTPSRALLPPVPRRRWPRHPCLSTRSPSRWRRHRRSSGRLPGRTSPSSLSTGPATSARTRRPTRRTAPCARTRCRHRCCTF